VRTCAYVIILYFFIITYVYTYTLFIVRYYANLDGFDWPPEIYTYNENFTKLIENIKQRHDPVVTTMVK